MPATPNVLTNTSTVILTGAIIEGFLEVLLPVKAFATDFSAAAYQRGTALRILTVPNQGTVQDWDPNVGFVVGEADAIGIDLTINKHKFVAWGMSDVELYANNLVNLEMFGRQQGAKLAGAILRDILSAIVVGAFPQTLVIGAAAGFDSSAVAGIRKAGNKLFWPAIDRSLILSSDYAAAVLNDSAIRFAYALGSTTPHTEGILPRYMGFNLFETTVIDTGTADPNLVGLALVPNSMAVAMRYLPPQSNEVLTESMSITNDSGMTLGYRSWYDPVLARQTIAIDANYGYRALTPNGLIRLDKA